jgi:uncharacterized membrane-anchored protein
MLGSRGFREALGHLSQINGELFGEFKKRSTNLGEQANSSTMMRQYVKWTANLKAGRTKQLFLNGCSEAYKAKDFGRLSEVRSRQLLDHSLNS